MTTILHIDSSGRHDGSYSRKLTAALVKKLQTLGPDAKIIKRELAQGVEFVDQDWIEANFTPADERTILQKERLSGSDALVDEVIQADHIVIGAPIYNFSVPGVLKAWVDQICRAGVTFRYEPTGPVGLLQDKRAFIVIASGGTEVQGPADFATDYLKHVLGFIGIQDVSIVNAGQLMVDEEAALERAKSKIEQAA